MARSFNGSTTKMDMNALEPIATTGDSFTVGGWINAAAQSGQTCCFAQAQSTTSTNFVFLGISSSGSKNQTNLVVSGPLPTINHTGTSVVCDSTWHHICLVGYSALSYSVYVDGSLDFNIGASTYTFGTQNTATLGYLHRSSSGQFFNGTLSEWAKWTRSLSQPEIASLANGLPASHLGPNHYWPLWGRDSPEPDIGNG